MAQFVPEHARTLCPWTALVLGLLSTSDSNGDNMQQWEYRYVFLKERDLATNLYATLNEESWNAFLNREGTNGWELRQLIPVPDRERATVMMGWQFIFMRQKETE
jgi:hypothetical protein